MSKKTFALVLTIVFVLAFATSAYAAWGGTTYLSPNLMVGQTGNAPDLASPNPHGPYDTSTRKCAVCHAVHGADPGGQQLLMSGATDPCITCHIATDAGVKIVYNGTANNYTIGSEFAHNNLCKECHTVHGAGATNVTGAAQNLKGLPAYSGTTPRNAGSYNATFTVATNVSGTYTLSEWCSGCHPYLNQGYDSATHIMGAANSSTAWGGSQTCMSCHDATAPGTGATRTPVSPAVLSSKNFPHYTDGSRFLLQAATSVGTKSAVTAGRASYDAVCLKCHRDGAGNGVGLTF